MAHQKEDQLLAYLMEAVQKQVSPSWFSVVGLEFRFDLLRARMFSSPERFLGAVAALARMLASPYVGFFVCLGDNREVLLLPRDHVEDERLKTTPADLRLSSCRQLLQAGRT